MNFTQERQVSLNCPVTFNNNSDTTVVSPDNSSMFCKILFWRTVERQRSKYDFALSAKRRESADDAVPAPYDTEIF